MSERRKKAPKVAWRDLLKGTAVPAAPADIASPTSPEATTPVDARDVANGDDAEQAKPARVRKSRAKTASADVASEAPIENDAVQGEPVQAASVPHQPVHAHRDVAAVASVPTRPSPIAIARAAAAAMHAPSAVGDVTQPALRGAPPEINMPSSTAPTITASAPASSPEAEVHRILARLASNVPAPRPSVDTLDARDDKSDFDAIVPRGPLLPDEDEAAPVVTPAGLRDAARTRRGRVDLLLFRAGGELFALPLGAVEEAIEAPSIHALPEMPPAMLGVFNLRDRLVPTYSPASSLGVRLAEPAGAALMVRSGERRMALAADDVEDVMELDLSTLRDPPVVGDTDGILLGVARFARELVGVLDADALIVACIGGRTVEIS